MSLFQTYIILKGGSGMFQLLNYEEMPQLLLFYRNMFQLLLFFFSIGFFIFGMMLLRTGLFTLSAPSLNQWIAAQSESAWANLIKGILITTVMQNSSAEMVIKLVSARLVTVARSIGIILGILIGTAMINEVITLDIGALIIPIIVIGGILLFKKRKRIHNSGRILLGLALIFGSMWLFEYLAVPLNELEIINKIILAISHNYFYAIYSALNF
jgi:phosphate:Na+ symporter